MKRRFILRKEGAVMAVVWRRRKAFSLQPEKRLGTFSGFMGLREWDWWVVGTTSGFSRSVGFFSFFDLLLWRLANTCEHSIYSAKSNFFKN